MRALSKNFFEFRQDESGGVTVEWVVLASLATMVGLASTGVIETGFRALAGIVKSELSGEPVEQVAGISYSDGFDHGASGWSGADATEIAGVGNVLGPIGGSGGYPTITRDFQIDPDATQAQFEFDVLALDSLDNESGIVYLNGQEVGRITGNLGNTTFTPADGLEAQGINIRAEIVDNAVDLGSNDSWKDGSATIQLTLDNPGETVSFGFGSTADQGVNDESFAIDNFTARGLKDPDAPADPGV